MYSKPWYPQLAGEYGVTITPEASEPHVGIWVDFFFFGLPTGPVVSDSPVESVCTPPNPLLSQGQIGVVSVHLSFLVGAVLRL